MHDKYLELSNKYNFFVNKKARESNLIGWLRLIVSVIIACSLYFVSNDLSYQSTVVLIFSIAVFLILVKIHRSLRIDEKVFSNLKEINDKEYSYTKYGKLLFDDGEEYKPLSSSYINDIDLFGSGSLFQHINRTNTYIGKQRLSQIITNGLCANQILVYQESIQELTRKIAWIQKFRAFAMLCSDSKENYTKIVDWSKLPPSKVGRFQLALFYMTPVSFWTAGLLAILIKSKVMLVFSFSIFLINLLIFIINFGRVQDELLKTQKVYKAIEKYSKLVELIEQEEFTTIILKDLKSNLEFDEVKVSQCIRRLGEIFNDLETINNLWGVVLLNGFFLYHLHTLVSLNKWKLKYAFHLESYLNTVGEFDAMISLANFSFNNQDFIFPQINNKSILTFKNLSHPLINKDTRKYSDVKFQETRLILLTGSNMSGKSTFLRSLGTNIVLAKAGLPVCASEANVFPFEIVSCMRKTDSLQNNESYFSSELKSLKLVIDKLEKGSKVFILLDEILRGTNSKDKQVGTISLIDKLVKLKAIGVIATHDLEVCKISNKYPDTVQNKCFEAHIIDNKIVFDYKLRDGICKNTTASFMMKEIGIID